MVKPAGKLPDTTAPPVEVLLEYRVIPEFTLATKGT
jgi:hypothetical protein